MAEYDANVTTRTNFENNVDSYTVSADYLDQEGPQDETYWDYPDAPKQLGYYKKIPELKKAVDALAMWVTGKGFEAPDPDKRMLKRITGWGEDTIESINSNIIIQKKIFGDAYAEIIRNPDNNQIINIKPLYTGDMRVVVDSKGIIKRYEQRTAKGKKVEMRKFKPTEILHIVNDRIANEIHGTSVLDACQWVIDARNEAMATLRLLINRSKAMGVIEVDLEDEIKINKIIQQVEKVTNKGEILVYPKGTMELKDAQLNRAQIQETISWIRYLENFFYQALGIPKVILGGSEEFTEASSKIGYLTFEQVYLKEQRELEADYLNQIGVEIKFNKPASLKNELLDSEEKNTGQVGFQPNEVQAQVGRNE